MADDPSRSGGKPSGILHLVATPIGNARDISLRALDVLGTADILAAEDTRNTRKLLDIHGVKREARSFWPYHDHNGARQRPQILAALAEGKSVALVSDAGTPVVSDPGYPLVRAAIEAGYDVVAVPGASALLSALCIAGLPTDRFLFAGFLPSKSGARRRELAELAPVPSSLVFYESPHRLAASLAEMCAVLGGDREAAVCRELTKRFEEARRGTLDELAAQYANAPDPKGEIVVVVGPPLAREITEADIDTRLLAALEAGSLKDAASSVATELGLPRKQVYARALELASAK